MSHSLIAQHPLVNAKHSVGDDPMGKIGAPSLGNTVVCQLINMQPESYCAAYKAQASWPEAAVTT